MKIGFTIDEKCFNRISAEELINKASKNNITSVEISPDADVLTANEYKNIIKLVADCEFEVNYHIPYFANNIYDTNNFSSYKTESINKYEKFLSLIEDFQGLIKNNPIIVVHGARYGMQTHKKEGIYTTLSFIDWMINNFEARNLNFKLAIETLGIKDERSIGDDRLDLLYIIDNFKTEKLGVCWDMCHDALNYFPDSPPIDNSLLNNIIYSHIHGTELSKEISHISLEKSNIDYSNQLNSLIDAQYNGVVNIELLSNYCEETYIDDLFRDINYLNKFAKNQVFKQQHN